MSKLLPSMRPQVKADTYFLPDENGVFFRNNEGSFRMDGRTIYQWIETLVPMLDGEQSLQELTEELSEAQRNHVYHIVEVLYENGYLRDGAIERPHQLPASISKRYAHQIAFLEAFSDSAGYRFEQYRNAQVLIVGGGALLTATVAALYESGMPMVSICLTREDGTNRDRLREHAARAKNQDPMAVLNEIDEKAASADDWKQILEPFQGVIYVSDEGDIDGLYSLESICRSHGKYFIPVILFKKTGLAGPLVRPSKNDDFESMWRRLHQAALEPEDRELRPPSFTAAAMLANVAVFEMMKSLTGVLEGDTTHQFFRLDLETMEGDWHSVLPHPLRADETGIVRDVDLTKRMAIEGNPVQTENLLAFFSGITSQVTGVFHRWEEGNLSQLPLSQCLVEVTNPNSPGPATTTASLVGHGITHEEARIEAGFAGVEACAARIWGADFPMVAGRTGETRFGGVGIGAGRTMSEAVLRGLSAWLTHQLRTQVANSLTLTPVRDVKVKGERLVFLWDSLCAIQSRPGVGLGPLAAGFPSVWIRIGDVWYGSVATDLPQAVERAIKGALAAVQNGTLNSGDVFVLPDELLEFRDAVDVLVVEGQSRQDLFPSDAEALVRVQEKLRDSRLRLVVDELPLHEMVREGLAGVFAVSVSEEGRP